MAHSSNELREMEENKVLLEEEELDESYLNSGKLTRTSSSRMSSNALDRVLHMCSARRATFTVIALIVFMLLFTNLEISRFDHQRWLPQRLLPQRSNSVEQLEQKYDQQFKQQVLLPFQSLLKNIRYKFKFGDSSANISEILPTRVQLNTTQTMAMVEEESNLAARYFERWEKPNFGRNAVQHANVIYCPTVKMISPHLVRQNNLYWQVVRSEQPKMTVYAYNAYYDGRLWGKPAVKIVTVTDQQVAVEKRQWWCLLWFEDLRAPVLSNVTEVYTIWPEYWDFGVKAGIWGPQLVTCAIPREYASQVPAAVSLQTAGNCDAIDDQPTNVLRVIHNQPKEKPAAGKANIGVCVQAFRFKTYDFSVRLVEWLEMVSGLTIRTCALASIISFS